MAVDRASGPSDAATGWLQIAPGCEIRMEDITWRFTTSGGPGGQHANRSATRVEARVVLAEATLTPDQRERMVAKLGEVVTVVVDETRSQHRNRALALERLRVRLASALIRERPRRPTKPTRGAVERRLQAKRRRSDTKRHRGGGHDD